MSGNLEWRWPANARKAHIYEQGDAIALCGRWMYRGPTESPFDPQATQGPDDCTPCFRKAQQWTIAAARHQKGET